MEPEPPNRPPPVLSPPKKSKTPKQSSLTKSASTGGLVSTVSSWIPRFFGSPALRAEEAVVDGGLDISYELSPEKELAAWSLPTNGPHGRTRPAQSSLSRRVLEGPDDIFTPRLAVQETVDLTSASEAEDEDVHVPSSDDRRTFPFSSFESLSFTNEVLVDGFSRQPTNRRSRLMRWALLSQPGALTARANVVRLPPLHSSQ